MFKFTFSTTAAQSIETGDFIYLHAPVVFLKDKNGEKKFTSAGKADVLTKIAAKIFSVYGLYFIRRESRKNAFPVETVLTFDEDGIAVESAPFNAKIAWRQIQRVVNSRRYIILFSPDAITTLPKRAIEPAETAGALIDYIKRKIEPEIEIELINK